MSFIRTLLLSLVALATCASATINYAPAPGANVPDSTSFTGSATSYTDAPITGMQLWVDNALVASGTSSIQTTVSTSDGWHIVIWKAWDGYGNLQQAGPFGVYFGGSGGGGSSPSPNYADLDQQSGWQTCGSCSNAPGNDNSTSHYLTQGVGSPSVDGNSMQMWLGGGDYPTAIWWLTLSPTSASHFTWDVDFYIENPGASEALEWDINQHAGGLYYIYGFECGLQSTGQWDTWNMQSYQWEPTGISCQSLTPYVWHHATLEAERVNGQMHYVAVTLDGQKSYIDRYRPARHDGGGDSLSVDVQIDGTGSGTAYSVWEDRLELSAN